MTEGFLLDTHTWLWWEAGAAVFSGDAKLRIGQARRSDRMYVAAISLHEVAYAHYRKRLDLDVSLREWFGTAFDGSSPRVLPITTDIAMASAKLPDNFHGDPGDRLIAATAIVHGLTLCTHDRTLLRFGRAGLYNFLAI